MFPDDLFTIAEPYRQRFFLQLGLNDPFASTRLEDMRWWDGRFAANRIVTLLHVVLGGVLLILGPLQFSRRIRSRHIQLHRWSGRVLVVTTLVLVVPTGLYFGVLMPFGGASEAVAAVLFGGFCMAAVVRAFLAIRNGQVALHREWMIRAFAILIGISTIRVVGLVLDLTLTPAGYGPRELFALSFWTGWLITLGAAELWIRLSRGSLRSDELAQAHLTGAR